MKGQLEKLTNLYFRKIGKSNPSTNWVDSIQSQISKLINDGYTYSQIEDAIVKASKDFYDYLTTKPASTETTPAVTSSNNLMNEGVFYYHPRLQVAPPPPVKVLGRDGRLRPQEQTEFFLKMKESFTIDEMLQYFYSRFPEAQPEYKRDAAGMKWLIEAAGKTVKFNGDEILQALDLVLFTIDSASMLLKDTDGKLNNLLSLSDYLNYGMVIYQDKKDSCMTAGIYNVK